jgi:hypothetical protein
MHLLLARSHIPNWQEASEKLTRAMTDTVHHDEADALFDQAAEHYQDAVVQSYIQWGNVFMMKADRKVHVSSTEQQTGKSM